MKKKFSTILTVSLIVLVSGVLAVILFLSQRVTMNPAGTVGNTGGNLNNGGLFCEYNGKVYFANSLDGGSLCVMDPDEGNVRRLKAANTRNILAGGDYLYYYQQGSSHSDSTALGQLPGVLSLVRCKLNGSGGASLTTDFLITGQLVDNYLYLLTTSSGAVSFYKLKIDGSAKVELADYEINPACAADGVIYYNGTDSNHYLYALHTANDTVSEVWRGNLWYPVLQGDYVYYLDVANNYRLCRYSISEDVIQILTEDRVDCFNVGNGYVYYQKNSATQPQLRYMAAEGGESYVLAEGNYTAINMTSRYVYFREFNGSATYHAPLGSSSYSLFEPSL